MSLTGPEFNLPRKRILKESLPMKKRTKKKCLKMTPPCPRWMISMVRGIYALLNPLVLVYEET